MFIAIFAKEERDSTMSKSLKAILAASLITFVSAVLLQNHRLNIVRSARAAESSSVKTENTVTQERLHQLLLERKQILDGIADNIKKQMKFGRGVLREYSQARKTALLAGIDLCQTKEERISIRREIVRLHDAIGKQIQMEADVGQIGTNGLSKARADRLKSEIELLREQLK
jgi:hypothetical protein